MLTIYTSLKSGEGRVREIQARALANWRALGCEVVTLAGPVAFEAVARAAAEGASPVCAWCNADILFDDGLNDVVAWCAAQAEDYLIVGQRTDLLEGGQRELHRPSGMDYFIFRKGMFRDLPPTVMGRSYCDSALVAYCLRRGIRAIDATDVMTVTHQWHDYGHVAGGRAEVFGGEAAQANRRNNGLRDFGPHIADVKERFEKREGFEALRAVPKRVPLLRRMGLRGVWNRLTRGGIGFWGIREYAGGKGARFFTRSKIIQNYGNSNVVWKFNHVNEWAAGVYTGFDFPCLWRGWREKKRTGEQWTVFVWDPPALSHRDALPPLKWTIDFFWRMTARHCDKLVLNIHPGLLDEMGIRVKNGKWGHVEVEYRMQDAFEGMVPAPISDLSAYAYDMGILSAEVTAKGSKLIAEAMRHMPGVTCKWFNGLSQQEAFDRLRQCRVLVAPYLPVPSLKWNYALKLFEYLQLGRPILASDNPGNAAIAAKYPGRITLFKSGDWRDFVAKYDEMTKGTSVP